MRTTDAQVRKLMEEMAKHGRLGLAAARPWGTSRAVVLALQTACATSYPTGGTLAGTSRSWRRSGGAQGVGPAKSNAAGEDLEVANLRRAARLPWTDGGQCVVEEASQL